MSHQNGCRRSIKEPGVVRRVGWGLEEKDKEQLVDLINSGRAGAALTITNCFVKLFCFVVTKRFVP